MSREILLLVDALAHEKNVDHDRRCRRPGNPDHPGILRTRIDQPV